MLAQPKVGIVLVNLNAYQDTAVCLDSLQGISYQNVEVIVVNNGSRDDSGERLSREYPWATHLDSGKNLGFTGGNNLGIDHAVKNGADHVLLLNNDTIVTPGFLEPLVAQLEHDPSIAAVSGKIYYAPQAMHGRSDVLWYAGCFQKWHTGYHHNGVFEPDAGHFNTVREVPYASGCLMLMNGSVIRKQGMLSDEYFIYWEEADWCHRAREQGYKCLYEPKSVIYHNFTNAPKGKEKPFYMYMQTRNAFLYSRKHYKGKDRLRYWLFYPIYLSYMFLTQLRSRNFNGARAMIWGVVDYFRGYRGSEGLTERGFIKVG